MELGKKVKALRESKGWSQTDFAKKVELHPSQVSSLENEKIPPFQDFAKYELFANVFGLDAQELWQIGQRDRKEWKIKEHIRKAGIPEKLIRPIPILSKVPNSIPDNPEDFPSEIITGFYDSTVKDPKAFMYEVEGDFMAPEIKKGDLLLIYPSEIDKVKSGDIVAITNGKGARRLRRVTFEGDQAILTADNSAYPVMVWKREDKPKIIGRVKEIIRRR